MMKRDLPEWTVKPVDLWLRACYLILVMLTAVALLLTVQLRFDVVVALQGTVRPVREKAAVRIAVSGNIDSIFFKEGDPVRNGQLLASLQDRVVHTSINRIKMEESMKRQRLEDLRRMILCLEQRVGIKPIFKLNRSKAEWRQFEKLMTSFAADTVYAAAESRRALLLYNEKVIAAAEAEGKKAVQLRLHYQMLALRQEKLTTWNNEIELLLQNQLNMDESGAQLVVEMDRRKIIAPVTGNIQGIKEHYASERVQEGDLFCEITPDVALEIESFTEANNIAFLQKAQQVQIKVPAFHLHHFGLLHGEIQTIDNDIQLLNNRPVIRVTCSIRDPVMQMPNGFKAMVRKGMVVEVRVVLAKRTIGQLLFDKLSNWVDPVKKI